ncbi:protein of unknown function DUF218 [Candidatus Koribacter versatilis Ellin345]|uniref:DUF218 domain-containing protein n=1 Tax=Koribacter versatilis (strain Ellin345) TaxID=204669 RepID=Q1IND8_KORVE|nr:YdcF family protein [Candidatus Koribacter versatilis]ABF41612.1 protein of unknown function DUF218 [Candidatus Koribacter versatilis Ellin345]
MTRVPFARRKIAALVLTVVVAGALFFYAWTCVRVMQQAETDERRPVDAIVVFGAAEYSGRPSPVLKARLDHGLDLFRQDMAPFVITTGGAGGDLHFSEGGVGRDYLLKNGVPDASLIGETQGGDTAQSAERVAVIMRTNGMKTCLAVSDAYHLFRVKRMMEEQGMECYGSPRPGSVPRTFWARFWAIQREAFSYCLWKLRVT